VKEASAIGSWNRYGEGAVLLRPGCLKAQSRVVAGLRYVNERGPRTRRTNSLRAPAASSGFGRAALLGGRASIMALNSLGARVGSMALIETRSLTKDYGHFKAWTASTYSGAGHHRLVGANGAGKSTLLKILLGSSGRQWRRFVLGLDVCGEAARSAR